MEFSLEASCIIISTNIADARVGVLSLDDNNIVFPSISLDENNISSIGNLLVEYVASLIFIPNILIYPQIISITKKINSESTNSLSVNYGFLIPEQVSTKNNSHWIEFNYTNPEGSYANIIGEVIQKLK